MSRPTRESAKTRYCFTFNLPLEWTDEEATTNGPVYLDAAQESGSFTAMIFQLERAPTTNRLHYQGFALLDPKKPIRLAGAKQLFDPIFPNCHLEPTRASTPKAVAYCEKEESQVAGPWRFGDLGRSQGQRNDLAALKDAVDNDVSAVELWDQHFAPMVRYHKSIDVYRNIKIAPRTEQTELIIMIGPTAVGKTTWIMDQFPGAYWISPPQSRGQSLWWDGYKQQPTVVFDEFRGWWFPFSVLLQLANKSPYTVQPKGIPGVQFTSARVIIATNYHPLTFYPNVSDQSPLERRITEIQVWDSYKSFTSYKTTDKPAWENYRLSDQFDIQRYAGTGLETTN